MPHGSLFHGEGLAIYPCYRVALWKYETFRQEGIFFQIASMATINSQSWSIKQDELRWARIVSSTSSPGVGVVKAITCCWEAGRDLSVRLVLSNKIRSTKISFIESWKQTWRQWIHLARLQWRGHPTVIGVRVRRGYNVAVLDCATRIIYILIKIVIIVSTGTAFVLSIFVLSRLVGDNRADD